MKGRDARDRMKTASEWRPMASGRPAPNRAASDHRLDAELALAEGGEHRHRDGTARFSPVLEELGHTSKRRSDSRHHSLDGPLF